MDLEKIDADEFVTPCLQHALFLDALQEPVQEIGLQLGEVADVDVNPNVLHCYLMRGKRLSVGLKRSS